MAKAKLMSAPPKGRIYPGDNFSDTGAPPQGIGEWRKAPLAQTDEQRSLASFTPLLQRGPRMPERM
jgi:hypothetical protein